MKLGLAHNLGGNPGSFTCSIIGLGHACRMFVVGVDNAQDIENAVGQLSADDLAAFRAWFTEFDTVVWDRQLEADVAAGRSDKFAEEARAR